ncbi:hypothetical protein OOK13_08735 [Streptomyces sp. NBC_00378]|uniref:hypothetical protein n=1 Tax=unclassified Streptomyces TaxID=2593676 RepID=UPI00225461CF|nr:MULTISPECIES: hypothetical protein [unclassified Streptomyces]MCX5108613.1 hypothetical protein [Streptomyces sp. NBC_00378]
MRRRRGWLGWRGYGVLAAAPLLLATACGGGAAKDQPGASPPAPRATAAVSRTPDATGKPVIDAAPARLPATRQSALDLIGRGIADPDDFGPGVVARRPYESGPDTWPVLGTDCVWQQAEPGSGVLTTLTRSVEVPAGQNARAEPADVAVTAKGAKGWMDARIGDLGVRAQSAGFTGSRVSTGPVLAPAFLRRPGRSPGGECSPRRTATRRRSRPRRGRARFLGPCTKV